MLENTMSEKQIEQADIVFECPRCGKSMAIDAKGAGCIVACPKCQHRVVVPDAENSPPPAAGETLAEYSESELKIRQLTASLNELSDRRKYLERVRAENLSRFKSLQDELAVIQQALDRINSLFADTEFE